GGFEGAGGDMGSGGFEESDLALVAALQRDPRAPWTRVGPAVGVDATTAARRWRRLTGQGLAWVTGYAAPGAATLASVEIECEPGRLAGLARHLSARPWVFTLEHVVGDHDLALLVGAVDLPALGALIVGDIDALPGIRRVTTRLMLRVYQEGGGWQLGALPPAGRALLAAPPPPVGSVPVPAGRYDAADRALLRSLGEDGRAGPAALAAETGLTEPTVRRRVGRLLRGRHLLLRCDVAQPLAGWPGLVTYRITVPHGELDRTGAALARLPQTRLAASVTGAGNLLLSVWLRDLDGMAALEALFARRFPRLRVDARSVTVRTVKRMGRLLDERGRAVAHQPLARRCAAGARCRGCEECGAPAPPARPRKAPPAPSAP
ncbi:Lrp/AsnC family transcriptional regulator, partial [Streptomyces sp. 8L]|uniref:Lrp/AsnC family transcriptional regulator n=1 Tax=Streptomyces sp. 8L TaxID=2877242 RepID=UPI0027E0208A